MAIVYLVGALVLAIAAFIFVKSRRGLAIAAHLHTFDNIYDATLAETSSKYMALRQALMVFKRCPRLKALSEEELERIAVIVGKAQDPKEIVDTLVLRLDSAKAVSAFKNEEFLIDFVEKFSGMSKRDGGTSTSSNVIDVPGIGLRSISINDRGQALSSHMIRKADDLLDGARVLVGILEGRLRRDHADFFKRPNAGMFTFYATVACVWCACVRLHFDIDKEIRTSTEMRVQESLEKWHSDAINKYREVHEFVSESLLEEQDRKKRGDLLFVLAAYWVLGMIADVDEIPSCANLAGSLASLFKSETAGYWKESPTA